jgi:hypothetical protein
MCVWTTDCYVVQVIPHKIARIQKHMCNSVHTAAHQHEHARVRSEARGITPLLGAPLATLKAYGTGLIARKYSLTRTLIMNILSESP